MALDTSKCKLDEEYFLIFWFYFAGLKVLCMLIAFKTGLKIKKGEVVYETALILT